VVAAADMIPLIGPPFVTLAGLLLVAFWFLAAASHALRGTRSYAGRPVSLP
jgi:hypothetical protein